MARVVLSAARGKSTVGASLASWACRCRQPSGIEAGRAGRPDIFIETAKRVPRLERARGRAIAEHACAGVGGGGP